MVPIKFREKIKKNIKTHLHNFGLYSIVVNYVRKGQGT